MIQADNENKERGDQAIQREADKIRPRRSIFVYLAILFGVAFLFLLLSYLMQQRGTIAALEGLTTSVRSMQDIEILRAENDRLDEENDRLRIEAVNYEAEINALREIEKANAKNEKTLEALDLLRHMSALFKEGRFAECRETADRLEALGLVGALPSSAAYSEEPPAREYMNMLKLLREIEKEAADGGDENA